MKFALTEIPELHPNHRSAMHKYFRQAGIVCERIKTNVPIQNAYGMKNHSRVQKINHYNAQEVAELLGKLDTEKELLRFAKEKILEYLR